MQKIRLDIIGDPVSHSKSPIIHSTVLTELGLDFEYRRVRVKKGELEDYLDEECEDYEVEDDFYSVICPNCGEEFCVDDDTAQKGELNCPNCNEELEFDLSDCDCCEGDCDCCE